MSTASQNRLTVTKNATNKTVTLVMERRGAWGSVWDRFQFTIEESKFDKALLDAQIIAPWNQVGTP